ncbi:MDR family MFS transporter [Enterovirga rhinocerotis]|uniref:EmrB/QacA subfamily drug resistance transporter n=1 Tax=Enterovirga rhinocerotis TaxID=1339210 RepID=A0A4R7C970_9HYPH|nr:MDR family MFS transporter [Enterovirga rhinocerotis]TDR93875.1 EmrB/QacA subfamily drug resistance transporter [Enterovirga rhinocerotis]
MGTDAGPGSARQPLTQADIRSVFIGMMLAMFLSALDGTIVATAMPTIGRELGDVQHLPWIVTAYLLASTIATPLYGKFADMHGRRVTMLVAVAVFIIGSIACALAPSLLTLALARGVQGLGGGGLIALAQTIIADLVTPRERGRYQAYFGGVFAAASVLGPVLGGFFAQMLHWSLIFWINLPLGLFAFWLINDKLKRLPRRERQHRLDLPGAVLLVGATTSLMLMMNWGGHDYAWLSPQVLGLAAVSLLAWIGFFARLATAHEPLIPLAILADRVVAAATFSGALCVGTYVGLSIMVPIFFETSLGLSARQSGLALIPFMIGVPIGATISGRTMAVVANYKAVPTAGLALSVLCFAAFALLAGDEHFWLCEVLLAGTAFGIGTVFPVVTVALQNAAPIHHLGTATATMNFMRQLAGAIIVAIFGAIALGGGGLAVEGFERRGAVDAAAFRIVFFIAVGMLAAALAIFALMEQRPLRDTAPPEERSGS